MSVEKVEVIFSGPLLSMLALDGLITAHKEGYLLGRVSVSDKIAISDSSNEQREQLTEIAVSQCMPRRVIDAVCSTRKQLCFEDLELLRAEFGLRDPQLRIVGWYRIRRCTTLTPSCRESITHRRLSDALRASEVKDRRPGSSSAASANTFPLVFALFMHLNSPDTRHLFDYAAFALGPTPTKDTVVSLPNKVHGGPSEAKSLTAVNLRVANLASESQCTYQPISTFSTHNVASFGQLNPGSYLSGKLERLLRETSGLPVVSELHDAAQESLKSLQRDLVRAAAKQLRLREEVEKLEAERLALENADVCNNADEREYVEETPKNLRIEARTKSDFKRAEQRPRASGSLSPNSLVENDIEMKRPLRSGDREIERQLAASGATLRGAWQLQPPDSTIQASHTQLDNEVGQQDDEQPVQSRLGSDPAPYKHGDSRYDVDSSAGRYTPSNYSDTSSRSQTMDRFKRSLMTDSTAKLPNIGLNSDSSSSVRSSSSTSYSNYRPAYLSGDIGTSSQYTASTSYPQSNYYDYNSSVGSGSRTTDQNTAAYTMTTASVGRQVGRSGEFERGSTSRTAVRVDSETPVLRTKGTSSNASAQASNARVSASNTDSRSYGNQASAARTATANSGMAPQSRGTQRN